MKGAQGLGVDVDLIDTADKTFWLYRPVLVRLCKYTDLHDGTLDLNDVATLNELLDVDNENQRRIQRALEKQRGG